MTRATLTVFSDAELLQHAIDEIEYTMSADTFTARSEVLLRRAIALIRRVRGHERRRAKRRRAQKDAP